MRATAVLFLLTGLVSASWAARVPAVQEGLGLSAAALGLAVLGLEAGAVAGLPAGAALVRRLGPRPVARLGFAAYPPALAAAGLAPGLGTLVAALALMAFANSLVDVALNVAGVALERRACRPRLGRLHAGQAAGVVAGGLAGTAAAAARVPVWVHFGLVAAVALLGGLAATAGLPRRRPASEADAPGASGALAALRDRRLVLLGALAFCAFLLDGAASAWTAVHLRSAGAAPALAAAGFTAVAVALVVGRMAGDRLVGTRGRARVVQGGALLAGAGVAGALAAPTAPLALAGWAAFGLGLAPLAPAILGAAPGRSRLPAPAAIATTTTIGYLGSFSGPPLIGALAGPIGLTAALGLLCAAAAAAALLARRALG